MVGMGENKVVSVVVVGSDKLIRLIRSGRRRRRYSMRHTRYWVYGIGNNQSINLAQNIQHGCAGAHNLLDLEERTMENETRIT